MIIDSDTTFFETLQFLSDVYVGNYGNCAKYKICRKQKFAKMQIGKICKTEPVIRSKEMLHAGSVAPLASLFVPRSLERAMMRKTPWLL